MAYCYGSNALSNPHSVPNKCSVYGVSFHVWPYILCTHVSWAFCASDFLKRRGNMKCLVMWEWVEGSQDPILKAEMKKKRGWVSISRVYVGEYITALSLIVYLSLKSFPLVLLSDYRLLEWLNWQLVVLMYLMYRQVGVVLACPNYVLLLLVTATVVLLLLLVVTATATVFCCSRLEQFCKAL